MERIIIEVPQEKFCSFVEINKAEIAHEVHVILLLNPAYRTVMTDIDLQRAARILVWLKHNRDPDDGWKRPRKPKPEPPLPQGNGARRILEPA